MKKKYNNIFLIAAFILSMIFSGCSKEIDDMQQIPVNIPELQFGAEAITVKIGSENTYSLDIKQGGGEYNVFSLNEEIATAKLADNKIFIEGVANGTTSVVVSDKNGFYRKLPVKVYTTETMVLKDYNLEITTLLGYSDVVTTNVTLGNGEYQVTSDNPKVEAKITEDGTITITGTSKKDTFTANVKVTDASGLSASIAVTVKSTTEPYSAEKLKEIMSDNSQRYFLGEINAYDSFFNSLNTQEDGQQLYGWDFYNMYYYKLWFTGDKSVGKKKDGKFSYSYFAPYIVLTEEPVDFEIIKNDGANIWGIFSFVKNEILYYGYFCDKI